MSTISVEISNFFLAMQAGRPGAEALRGMFAEDATYEEPFTGEVRRHEGRDAIIAAMALGWEMPMEDTRIEVRHADTKGGEVQIGWTCYSPSIPGGQGQGLNRFQFRDGLIASLITTLDDA
ncbi:MAG: hypothetical protein GKR98_08935 [Boseongicola sp.]|nr:MAG: hypothetical protein GKR98_08935 [Boseongicola sp.]